MNMLVLGSLDTPQHRLERTKFFSSVMLKGLQGDDAAEEIAEFIAAYEGSTHEIFKQFHTLLADNESDLVVIAGRFKYLVASLEILKTCGKFAATTDGLCRQIAGLCMANIYGEVEGLKDTLAHTQLAVKKTV